MIAPLVALPRGMRLEKQRVNVPMWAGVALVIAGGGLLLMRKDGKIAQRARELEGVSRGHNANDGKETGVPCQSF